MVNAHDKGFFVTPVDENGAVGAASRRDGRGYKPLSQVEPSERECIFMVKCKLLLRFFERCQSLDEIQAWAEEKRLTKAQ